MRTKELFAWIKERYSISQKKLAGKSKPWTADLILQSYRFCNVHREDDKVTIWIRENWREPYDADPNLWFAMTVARLINWPESLAECQTGVFARGKVAWSPSLFTTILDNRKANGEKVFTGAYMIHADRFASGSKAGYLAERVLTPMWEARKRAVGPSARASLVELHSWLTGFRDMGSFMSAQVVADVKYQTTWRTAPDWETFAAPGPGSQRGLNRVFGGAPLKPWLGKSWYTALMLLKKKIDLLVEKAGIPSIHAQDLQNCLCEFDKYERVRLGEGKPRSKYPGGK